MASFYCIDADFCAWEIYVNVELWIWPPLICLDIAVTVLCVIAFSKVRTATRAELWPCEKTNECNSQVLIRWAPNDCRLCCAWLDFMVDLWHSCYSPVCRASPGDTLLFCKGADSSIFPRVKPEEVERIRTHVERNATVGQYSQLSRAPSVFWS